MVIDGAITDAISVYPEFTVFQTMEHFLGCHQNAFDYFGGVPKKTDGR